MSEETLEIMAREVLTRSQLAKLVEPEDVTSEQIASWTRKGVLVPAVAQKKGMGFNHLYDSLVNVFEVLFIRYYQDKGFTLEEIARILDAIRKYDTRYGRDKNAPMIFVNPERVRHPVYAEYAPADLDALKGSCRVLENKEEAIEFLAREEKKAYSKLIDLGVILGILLEKALSKGYIKLD